MHKLVIITSHPIQYNAPFFKQLSQSNVVKLHVIYTWSQSQQAVYDPGFGKLRQWDIPLLEGYSYQFVENIAKQPGSHHFFGIDNPTLISTINKIAPDVLLVYGWSFKSHLKVLRHFHGKVPIWFRGDSTLLDEENGSAIKNVLRRVWLRWVFKHVDCALYAGTSNKDYYLAHGLKNGQLVHLPHCVENERFSANEEAFELSAKEWRMQLGIAEGALVFLFSGKFEPKKDPLLLLKAFSIARRANDYLIFVGDGVLKATIEDTVKSLSIQESVRVLPFQNQLRMPAVYRLGDVFVLPSKGPGETWGLAINEAMACKRAVLVSDKCGAAKDLVHNAHNGFVFKHGDVNDLVEKMRAIQNLNLFTLGKHSAEMIASWNYKKMVAIIKNQIKLQCKN